MGTKQEYICNAISEGYFLVLNNNEFFEKFKSPMRDCLTYCVVGFSLTHSTPLNPFIYISFLLKVKKNYFYKKAKNHFLTTEES